METEVVRVLALEREPRTIRRRCLRAVFLKHQRDLPDRRMRVARICRDNKIVFSLRRRKADVTLPPPGSLPHLVSNLTELDELTRRLTDFACDPQPAL